MDTLAKTADKQGLYSSAYERDSCGIGCVVELNGNATHAVLGDALEMLERMEHRGGRGSDPLTGDGAGISLQIPDELIRSYCDKQALNLPAIGEYGVGMLFFPRNPELREECRRILNRNMEELDLELIGYRLVPVDPTVPGSGASLVEPHIEQVFVKSPQGLKGDDLERRLFILRNYSTHYIGKHVLPNKGDFYVPSFSCRTIVYKGQLRTDQLIRYYNDLTNKKVKTTFALVHSRFSTNTFPNWKLAQPFRFLAHNGEINTIRGNLNKMKSKESVMESDYFSPEDMEKLLPVTDSTHSDSANLDALVEILTLSGRPLAHSMMMLIPEAWQDNRAMDPDRKAFYKYHSALMEPWDGPAALVFTNGKEIGATLDRNGLRPARYCITKSGRLVIASEAGALKIDPADIIENGRLQPGKILIAEIGQGRVKTDDEIKKEICSGKPYYEWIRQYRAKLRDIPTLEGLDFRVESEQLPTRHKAFGYSREDLKTILIPMIETGAEPVGSMGMDTPPSFLSGETTHIASYFKQLFAQVSNPPIDPIRERLVMSLFTKIGHSPNILKEIPEHCRQIHISQPVLKNSSVHKARNISEIGYHHKVIDCTFSADESKEGLKGAILRICEEAEKAVEAGIQILILTDRSLSATRAPIPSLMSTGAVHHHLISRRLRNRASLILEAGDVWETHHFATVIGYGASAINPYLAQETVLKLNRDGKIAGNLTDEQVLKQYEKAINYGLLKILSKMGISTLQSYQGAQIFEALGLDHEVIELCFTDTDSRLGGVDFEGLQEEVLKNHRKAFQKGSDLLPEGGVYHWRRNGEMHLVNPDSVHLLQKSTSLNDFSLFKQYTDIINDQTRNLMTLRGMLKFRKGNPIPLEEVESEEMIMRRFATGAMSFGSISHEAHSTLAIAMNRIGAKSNSGEGGEDEIRFERKKNGDWERSAIKQVASGRFGVTSHYLTNAEELQIKMAQGAKPGEGGQLPGHKVDDWIGRVRHSTPGVGLISPPPHHDIYSIEDLAQLIYDLKNANKEARINVKLVSEIGVGTIAAGVAKAKAEAILISGADGGTGASPISSIRHAGMPWELGLAEAHQTLLINNLRSRITLQTDGKIMTGRDLAIATLLGAEEWGVSTAALIVEGCIMMRKCHLNTCPVGIATQRKELRELFSGDPEHVVTFFRFMARDLREIMATLGLRTINEMVGRTDLLEARKDIDHWKFRNFDLSPILHKPLVSEDIGVYHQIEQDFNLEKTLDQKVLDKWGKDIDSGKKVNISLPIENVNRTVGAAISNRISQVHGSKGLKSGSVKISFNGSAGQSFGAFLAPGVSFTLEGESNDYTGKGLSGGEITIFPPSKATFVPEENIIIGNVAFYGATSGRAFIRGKAGERFAVRNSGVEVVVEGVGDHACEYMTGGRVIVLGETGRNFGAGMSGGIAYVFDPENTFGPKCNPAMVSLDPLEAEDSEYLKEMLNHHANRTESALAIWLLSKWERSVTHFVKVFPNDYKRVLMESRESQKINH